MTATKRYAILGAGLAGLTCADVLTKAGHEVSCFEAGPEVGGLARNIEFQGHLFDIGGHRFFTENETVRRYVRELMGDELLDVVRKSRILLNGRFSDYPLKPVNAILGMGIGRSVSVVAGYAKARLSAKGPEENFEQWVVARFGRPLYDVYFGPYTRKVWGCDPRLISADWASQRIQLLSLGEAVRKAVLRIGQAPRTYASSFWYPRRGIGRISARIAERVRGQGGRILLSHPVRGIERTPGGFSIAAGTADALEVDAVVSTIPLPLIAALLGEDSGLAPLKYRCLRCVFLVIDRPRVSDDTWIYTPDPHAVFARIHEPKNWSAHMVPGSGTSLCLEIFCDEGDELWTMPSADLHRRCETDLIAMGFLKDGEVRAAHDIKVKNAYPVFYVGYETILGELRARISRHPGLHAVGRTGNFTYTNMDQVIGDALDLTAALLKDG